MSEKKDVLPIRILGDKVLREKASPIEDLNDEIIKLARKMEVTMKMANGIGLAAPQVGKSIRLFVVDAEYLEIAKKPMVFINPQIVETYGESEFEEGCLSIPGLYANVTRPRKIVVKTLILRRKKLVEREFEADELFARVIQHELDHLDGVLFIDHLPPEERVELLREWSQQRHSMG